MEVSLMDGKLFVPKEILEQSEKLKGGNQCPLDVSSLKSMMLACSGFYLPKDIPRELFYTYFPNVKLKEVTTDKEKKKREKEDKILKNKKRNELYFKMKQLHKLMASYTIGCWSTITSSVDKLIEKEQNKINFLEEVSNIIPKDIKVTNILNFIACLTKTDKAVLEIYENSHGVVTKLYDRFLLKKKITLKESIIPSGTNSNKN